MIKYDVKAKIPTAKSAAEHKAGGGNVVITDKVGSACRFSLNMSQPPTDDFALFVLADDQYDVKPKIPTAKSAAEHKAGGGDVKIVDKVSHLFMCDLSMVSCIPADVLCLLAHTAGEVQRRTEDPNREIGRRSQGWWWRCQDCQQGALCTWMSGVCCGRFGER